MGVTLNLKNIEFEIYIEKSENIIVNDTDTSKKHLDTRPSWKIKGIKIQRIQEENSQKSIWGFRI